MKFIGLKPRLPDEVYRLIAESQEEVLQFEVEEEEASEIEEKLFDWQKNMVF